MGALITAFVLYLSEVAVENWKYR